MGGRLCSAVTLLSLNSHPAKSIACRRTELIRFSPGRPRPPDAMTRLLGWMAGMLIVRITLRICDLPFPRH